MHDRAVSPEQPIMACDKLVVGTRKASGLGHRFCVQIEVVALQIWIEYSAVFFLLFWCDATIIASQEMT